MNIVISQPMFLPWYGMFEQMLHADIFVHYDDVCLPNEQSFMTRVQIKTSNGATWLRLPVRPTKERGKKINEIYFSHTSWRAEHLQLFRESYCQAQYFEEVYALLETIYQFPSDNLAEFTINSLEYLASYLEIHDNTTFVRSSHLGIPGKKGQRVIDICQYYNATGYISGRGALDYLDHHAFENQGIQVQYLEYNIAQYPQLHGEFTPYVSIIDLIAHCGRIAKSNFSSRLISWRELSINNVERDN